MYAFWWCNGWYKIAFASRNIRSNLLCNGCPYRRWQAANKKGQNKWLRWHWHVVDVGGGGTNCAVIAYSMACSVLHLLDRVSPGDNDIGALVGHYIWPIAPRLVLYAHPQPHADKKKKNNGHIILVIAQPHAATEPITFIFIHTDRYTVGLALPHSRNNNSSSSINLSSNSSIYVCLIWCGFTISTGCHRFIGHLSALLCCRVFHRFHSPNFIIVNFGFKQTVSSTKIMWQLMQARSPNDETRKSNLHRHTSHSMLMLMLIQTGMEMDHGRSYIYMYLFACNLNILELNILDRIVYIC